MKPIESNPLPESSKIACCLICTLATVMKDCKNCPFNVGLQFKAVEKEHYSPGLSIFSYSSSTLIKADQNKKGALKP